MGRIGGELDSVLPIRIQAEDFHGEPTQIPVSIWSPERSLQFHGVVVNPEFRTAHIGHKDNAAITFRFVKAIQNNVRFIPPFMLHTAKL